MISQGTIDRIFDTSQIADVVGDFVNLKRRGTNMLGLCPFHNEKTPSFIVSPAKNIFKCFGCGKGGNPVNFIMEHEKFSYYEALKYLAKKYHIEVEETEVSSEELEKRNEQESLLIVTEFARKHFIDNLHKHAEGQAIGLSYFKERGFRDDIIEKFQLGYAIEKRDFFTESAKANGFKVDFMVKTGLTIEGERGLFDRFAGRVMFPIHSLSGKTIAFGGRILKVNEKTAKYLNSPESEIYHKSRVLYGIYFAAKAIQKHNRCILVEGYTDVISMHQCGIENVVASSGTSLTEDQIKLIKRFTNNLTILYDGDNAGIKAAIRGIDMVLEQDMNVKVLLLPDGHDPDSYASKHSATEVISYIEKNETDFIQFKTRLLVEEVKNDPIKRATLITDIVKTIAIIPNGIVRSVYIKECAAILKTEEQVLYTEISKIRKESYEQKFKPSYGKPAMEQTLLPQNNNKTSIYEAEGQERELSRIMMLYGNRELIHETDPDTKEVHPITLAQYITSSVDMDDMTFEHPVFKNIYDEIKNLIAENKPIEERFFTQHPDPTISQIAADLLNSKYEQSKLWTKNSAPIQTEEDKLFDMVAQTLMNFKNKRLLNLIRSTNQQLIQSFIDNDFELVEELQIKIVQLNQVKKSFALDSGSKVIIK